MIRFSIAHWSVFFAIVALGLYGVKYQVQDIRDDVELLEASLKKEQESVRMLKAEWGYLNRPERLRGLSEKYLTLSVPNASAIVSFDVLPNRENLVADAAVSEVQ